MAKQILIDIKEKKLSEVAHDLMIYFPYDEKMCSYTDVWMGELYENKYPLVSKGMWSGIIDLKTNKLLNWKSEYGDMYLQAKVCDSGTYFLLDKDKKAICKIAGYVPNIEGSEAVERIDTDIEEEPILDTRVEFTYSQLMAKLLRLPKFLQLEIGKALVANASDGFEEDE